MPRVINHLISLLLAVAAQFAFACDSSLPLHGSISIESCDPKSGGCIPAAKALYEYANEIKDDPARFSIAVQSSPWHIYDNDMRILDIEELAEKIRPSLGKKGKNRVILFGSWTGVAPYPGAKSLAQKLSEALDGVPVDGMDGFLWLSKQGEARTTHQAFSLGMLRRPYAVRDGDDVMASLVAGWPALFEDMALNEKNPDEIMLAGAGWEIFFLCPDRALKLFEAAANLSNPIAAYNAAMIHLERGKKGDLETARKLLSQAAHLGDKTAQLRLQKLKAM